jgi:UDP:flavonoid glycosyltransferase YjiC (YdhE family)
MRSVILAQEATRCGLKVVIPVLDREQAALVESVGGIAVIYPLDSIPNGLWAAWADQGFVSSAIREDIELIRDFSVDLVIHDGRLSSNIAADACGVPAIGVIQHIHFPGHTYLGRGLEPLWPDGARAFNSATARYGIQSATSDLRSFLTASPIVVPSIPELDPLPTGVEADITYVGPLTGFTGIDPERSGLPSVSDEALIFYKTVLDEYQTEEFAAAFSDIKERVFIATGSEPASDRLRSLRHLRGFAIAPLWDLSDIQGRGCSAVTHGGHGTTLTFLQAGVPAVVLPDGSPERQANARHVQEMGAALCLQARAQSHWDWANQGKPETSVSWQAVRHACEEISADQQVHEQAERIATRLARYTVSGAFEHLVTSANHPDFSHL